MTERNKKVINHPDSNLYNYTNLINVLYYFVLDTLKMDFSKLPKIQDEEREGQFGYVHGVSGPG